MVCVSAVWAGAGRGSLCSVFRRAVTAPARPFAAVLWNDFVNQ